MPGTIKARLNGEDCARDEGHKAGMVKAAELCESGVGDVLSNDECCRANAAAIRRAAGDGR